MELAGEREVLLARGRRLMAASSEVRAADIQAKINRLTDRWQHLQDVANTRCGLQYVKSSSGALQVL